MLTKAELYAQMADKVATQLTGSWQEWAGFLTTASRLYKYPFHEQLMIYAQQMCIRDRGMSGRKPRHKSFGRTGSSVIAYCPITTIC